MTYIASCLHLLFCLAYQGPSTGEAQFRVDRPNVTLQPAKQAILVNVDGPPVVFRINSDLKAPAGARIRAELIGPGLASPIEVDQPAEAQMITLARVHFQQEGIYELTQVRLESGGTVLGFATPRNAEIQVSQEFLVSEVSVAPLSEQDLLDLGYVFHADDYVAVNFRLALSVETKPERVDVSIPVVFPRHTNTTFRPQVLQDPFSTYHVSPIFIPSPKGPNPKGDPVLTGEQVTGKRSPLMGLLLIPGQLKYLRSHFGVTCVLMNAAPEGFDVKAANMVAELKLPLASPAGLPLTIAEPTRQVMINLGPDGTPESADDSYAVDPGEKARAKYVITGNVPGFHDFEVLIRGDLHLPQGKESFSTRTNAAVYVRSPDYSLSFEHPDAVEADEEYDLLVRVVNTGQIAMEGFELVLDGDRLQGVRLAVGQHPVQNLGTIPIGGEGTATYRLRSQVTGKMVAGYVKINQVGQTEDAVSLRVAVGDIGQRLSPYTLHFAEEFFDRFPADLTDALKRYAKKALDTSLTANHDLPADLLPTSSRTVRSMNRAFVRAAKGPDFGMSSEESLIQLLREWIHPRGGYVPLDHIRRKILNLEELPLETAFASALASRLPSSAESLLTQLSQENEDLEDLHLFIIDASGPVAITLASEAGIMNNAGLRNLPFAGMFVLDANKTLLWCSEPNGSPQLQLSPQGDTYRTATVTALVGSATNAPRWLFQTDTLTIDRDHQFSIDTQVGTAQVQPDHRPIQDSLGTPVPRKPFELVSIAQVDKKTFAGASALGYHHQLYFSNTVDLSSLYPLEEHITINGEPIAFGKLQDDKRTLLITSQMPLGPYHPIAYQLKDVRANDGQVLALDEGTYTGSASYRGVSVEGRVADRMGTDLTKAKAFLWYWDKVRDPENFPDSIRDNQYVLRIVHTENPGVDGRWRFDFVPTIPAPIYNDPFIFRKFKVGILLEDGRYQEQTFRPQGAGQVVAAEFAFFQLGTVQGRITSGGQGIPFTTVFVASENNSQSAAIVETDADGYYRADQIQVGQVLVKAAYQNQVGLIGGFLSAYNYPMVLDLDIATPSAHLVGTVTESINGEVRPLEDVFVGYASVGRTFNRIYFSGHQTGVKFVAITKTDSAGQYELPEIPAGQGDVWFYHHDYGLKKRALIVLEHETQAADYQFQFNRPETGRISGYVENVQGQRIAGAKVALGSNITFTDANGYYELEHVPKNRSRTVWAFHATGSGQLGLYLEQDVLTDQTIVLYGSVPLSGTYLDAKGDPVPFAPVYMSYLKYISFGGFTFYSDYKYFGQTDFAGRWQGKGPKQTIYRFTGFDPPEHAYAGSISVGPAGQADIVLQKSGLTELRVRLLDADGAPVIGKVDLKSLIPSADIKTLGQPSLETVRTDVFTDENGYVTFTGLTTGEFEVFGHLNALGVTETYSGILTLTAEGEPQTVTLAFPPPETPSNLFGTIYQPGGLEPAPDGTIVRLKGPGVNAYVIASLAGTYRFENLELGPDPLRLELIAYNPSTQHFYRQWLDLNQDLNFRHDLILRKRMTVSVSVEHADGEPVAFAEVRAEFLDMGHDPVLAKNGNLTGDDIQVDYSLRVHQVTPEEPVWTLDEIPSGPLVLRALTGNGLTGMKRIILPLDRDAIAVTIRLETASQISGLFVDDNDAPLTAAPVALKKNGDRLHQLLSGEEPGNEGAFLFDALPMGRYDLEGVDPATSRRAHLAVTTSPFRPTANVTLKLDPVASLTGLALFEGEPVANATIVLRGKHLRITTGTDANGRYRFANLPLGNYNIKGQSSALPSRIFDEFRLNQANITEEKDLHFGEVRQLQINLNNPDGTPVSDVLLKIYRGANQYNFPVASSAYTDASGTATLQHLPMGRYRIRTERLNGADAVYQILAIHEADSNPTVRTIQLAGSGTLSGYVTDSLSQPLRQPVHIRFAVQTVYGEYRTRTITTQADGYYRLGHVPVDRRIEATVYHPITREADHQVLSLDHDGEDRVINFDFKATTSITGQVRLPDGSPAAYAVVWTESPMRNETRTDPLGNFHLEPVLEGETTLFTKEANGARHAELELTLGSSDGMLLDPITDLELTLGGVADLEGIIAFAVDEPTRFGSVRLYDDRGRRRFQTRIQGDGYYVIPQVPLGDYELVAYSDRFGVESPPVLVSVVSDATTVQQDHFFEPSFTLSGTIYAPNHADPVPGATISLWRQRTARISDGYERIYDTVTDGTGFYVLEHVFPGTYVLKATNPDLTASHTDATFLMSNLDSQVPVYLETIIPLTGTIADASERAYSKGHLTLLQDGESTRLDIDPQGGFSLPQLRPTPYRLDYCLAGGWIEGSLSINQPNADPVSLRTVDTVTLMGRAILAKNDPPSRPRVRMIKGGRARKLTLANDGAFSLSRVPINEPIKLELAYRSAKKVIELGSFSADTDLGDFYLDYIKPELSFPAEGEAVSTLPHTFQFLVAEDEPNSDIDPDRTSVWVNGKSISSHFLTDQSTISASFDLLPPGFVIGSNEIKVRVYNTSSIFRETTYTIDVNLAGPTLVVDLSIGGDPMAGELQRDGEPWQPVAEDGRVFFHNLTVESLRLKARGQAFGKRQMVNISQAATQFVELKLQPIGSYYGQVLGPDGAPVPNLPITLNDSADYELTDDTGNFYFDLLPWQKHELWVKEAPLFGYVRGPDIINPEQVFLGVDIQLDGFGSVTGTVFDDDGITPVGGASISLRYTDLPYQYPLRKTTADANGVFQLDDVITREFLVTGKQSGTHRKGTSTGQIPQPGDTITTDIILASNSTITGTFLGVDGQPAADMLVQVNLGYDDGRLVAEAITDANGVFTMAEVPRDHYQLNAARDELFEYYPRQNFILSTTNRDFGNLQLLTDEPPTDLAITTANPYHPGVHRFITVKGNDDREIAHWSFTLSGSFSATFSDTQSSDRLNYHIQPRIPRSTPDGALHFRLEAWDHLGQSTVYEGDMVVLEDQFGPSITVVKPLDQAAVFEGQVIAIEYEAQDPAKISSTEVRLGGEVVATAEIRSYDSDAEERFEFSAIVPGVDEVTQVPLVIDVTDGEGNTTTENLTLQVSPIVTSGAPEVVILAPLADQPMPLWLEQGLVLQLAADAADPDGLGTYDISVNGVEVASGTLVGQAGRIEATYLLPPELRTASSLTVDWTIRDLGGNPFTATSTVQASTGSWLVKTALDPLNLPVWYQSPPEERSIVLAGGEHIIDGDHLLDRLVLVNGAVLSQTGSTAGDAYVARTQVTLTDLVLIDYASRIDVDGKGYLDLPQVLNLGTGKASHAGLGEGTSNLNQIYGSPIQPIHPGSHRGGGAMALFAENLWLLGDISASAIASTNDPGSGGSIWVRATAAMGHGGLLANGFVGVYADSDDEDTGSGGRIAIEADDQFNVQAFGGKKAGAGTVYRRRPDGTQPSGYFTSLTVANHPEATTTNKTWVRTKHDLIVGTDVTIETAIVDNETRHVLQFIDPAPLPPGSFLGMHVSTPGNYSSSAPVMFQTATSLQSGHQTSFGMFTDGDLVAVDYELDEVVVKDMGWFEFDRTQPGQTIQPSGGRLSSLETVVALGDLAVGEGELVDLRGLFQATSTTVAGTLLLNGHLTTGALEVPVSGTVRTQRKTPNASVHLTFTAGNIAGLILADRNGVDTQDFLGYQRAHGGLGDKTNTETYGSLYMPTTQGNSLGNHGSSSGDYGGGVIALQFESLQLSGTLNVTPQVSGSGGSILLEGDSLTGDGQLLAQAGPSRLSPSGGGRIAIRVADVDGFSGSTKTPGSDKYYEGYGFGGAGTVFYQTTDWPNGKLVVDNEGRNAPAGSTPLPGIGLQTVAAPTGGSRLDDSGLPIFNSLVGLYVTVEGHEPVAVADQDELGLIPTTSFPNLSSGASYGGLHRLDILEVRNGAKLKAIDPIEITTQFIVEGGEVDAEILLQTGEILANGAGELSSDPGWSSLELDNYHLVVDFPMQINQLVLRNNSSLTYKQPIQATDIEIQAGSSMLAKVSLDEVGLVADNLTVRNGATWTIADHKSNGDAYPLRATIHDVLNVEPGGKISTSGSSKVRDNSPQWAGQTWASKAHGGMPTLNNSANGIRIAGSFADPQWTGSHMGGGLIQLNARQFILDGHVQADGESLGTGGSIRINSDLVSGIGLITARPKLGIRGGGRIAIYHDSDASFLQTLTISTLPDYEISGMASLVGAGTLYVKAASQEYGDLIIDQEDVVFQQTKEMSERFWLTAVTGSSEVTLNLDDADPDPLVIRDNNWVDLPPGLAGLTLETELDGVTYRSRIVDNTHNTLFLETPLPAIVPAGTTLDLLLILDNLVLKNGAQLRFKGAIEIQEQLILEGDHLTSLYAKDLRGLPNPFTLNGRDFRLNLTEPSLENHDVALQQAHLYLDWPIAFQDITLVDGWFQHSVWNGAAYETQAPYLDVVARHLQADAESGFSVNKRVDYRKSYNGYGSPRPDGGSTYGSLFQPTHFGSGREAGGRIRLQAESIEGGLYMARSSYIYSGGSVWLDAQTLTGDIQVDVGMTDRVSGAGGRIALYYGDAAAANLTLDAHGSGAGGTIYVKDHDLPLGNLSILGDNLPELGSYNTRIPSFAPVTLGSDFTVNFDNPSQRSTLVLPGLDTVTNWTGYHLVLNGDQLSPIAIESSVSEPNQTTLVLSGDYSHLQSGDTLQLAVVLDQFEMSAGTHLELGDLLLIYNNDYPSNHVFQQGDGSFVNPPQTDDNRLILDDYQMELQTAANYDHIELRNGATLTVKTPGTLQNPVLSGTSLTITDGHVIADYLSFSGAVHVAAQGTIEAHTNPFQFFAWPPGTAFEDLDVGALSYGGIGEIKTRDGQVSMNAAYGSFTQPWTTGKERRALRINAGSLHVDGVISPDLSFDYVANTLNEVGGGALWVQTGDLSGTGTLHVNIHNSLLVQYSGGGRIALYYDDMSLWQGDIEAFSHVSYTEHYEPEYRYRGGSGTIFTKRSDQAYGDLRVTGSNKITIEGSTGLVGLGRRVLGSQVTIAGQTLTDPDQVFPFSLADLYLVYDHQGTTFETRILSNDAHTITVADPLPDLLPGSEIHTKVHLDNLFLEKGANLQTPDHLEIHGSLTFGSRGQEPSTLWARALNLASPTVTFTDQAGGLAIEESTNIDQLTIDDSEFLLDLPLSLTQLNLVNQGVLTHRAARNRKYRRYTEKPAVIVDATTIHIDGTSAINVTGKGYPNDSKIDVEEMWGLTSAYGHGHGGNAFSMYDGYAYGTPFEPQSYGFYDGAGRMHLKADQLELAGQLNASGNIGGSIWLEVGTASGDGQIQAHGGLGSGITGTGGRIAMAFDTNLLAHEPAATSPVVEHNGNLVQYGAGTVYLFNRQTQHGRLILRNQDQPADTVLPSPILGMGNHTLTASPLNPEILEVPGADWRYSLVGHHVVDTASGATYRVIANTPETLTLDRPITPAPASGWTFHGEPPIHAIELEQAQLVTEDVVVDRLAPTIDSVLVQPLANGNLTGGLPFTISVEASDNMQLSSVSVNFDGQTLVATEQPWSFSFTAPTPAQVTNYDLVVTATDAAGLQHQETYTYAVESSDQLPPEITILTPSDPVLLGIVTPFDVVVQLEDQGLVETVQASFNGENQSQTLTPAQQDEDQTFSFTTPFVPADTDFLLVVTATDASGNQASVTQTVSVGVTQDVYNLPKPMAFFTFNESDREGKYLYGLTRRHVGTNADADPNQPGQIAESFGFTAGETVEVPNSEDLDVTGQSFTVAGWVNPQSQTYTHSRILEKTTSSTDDTWRIILKLDSNTRQAEFSVNDGAGNENWATSPNPLPKDTWTHVVGVADGENLNLYLNGVLSAQTPWPYTVGNTTAPIFVGGSGTATNRYLKGKLDDIGMWREALTPSQVALLYQFGKHGLTPDFEPPEEVTDVTATSDVDQVTLHWTPSVNAVGDLASYRIYRDDMLIADNLLPSTSQWTDTGLLSATRYGWRISTLDHQGNESRGIWLGSLTPDDQLRLPGIPKPLSGWTLDLTDIQGNQVSDSYGAFDGTLTGGFTGEIGMVGEAIRFTADTDRVVIATGEVLDDLQEGSYSLAAWYRADEIPLNTSTTNRHHAMLMKKGKSMGLYYTYDQTFRMGHHLSSHSLYLDSTVSFQPGTYHHVVSTMDQTEGVLRLYIDGLLHDQATFTPNSSTYDHGSEPWRLGEARSTSSYRYPAKGTLDEPKVWNRALTADQVTALFQSENVGQAWDFEAPADAMDLSFTFDHSKVDFTWTAPPDPLGDRLGYRVWIDDASTPIELASGATAYALTGLQPSTLLVVRITAYDAYENESAGVVATVRTLDSDGSFPALPEPLTHWRLDAADNDGVTVLDVVGGHDGDIRGAPLTAAGMSAEGLHFTADSDAVYIPNHADLNDVQEGNYTLSTWFKPDALPPFNSNYDKHYALLMKQGSNLGLYYTSDGTFRMAHRLNSGGLYPDTTPAPPGEFYHVTGVVDRTAGTVKIYLNGVLGETETFSPSAAVNYYGNTAWRLAEAGPASHTYRWPAKGILDETYIWDEALTPEQVAILHQTVRGGQTPTFQKVTQTPARNQVPNFVKSLANHGELNGDGRLLLTDQSLILEDYQSQEDVVLIRSQFEVHGGLRLGSLELHQKSGIFPGPQSGENPKPLLLMTDQHVFIDRDSALILDGVGHGFRANNPSHGGVASGGTIADIYDSPFFPEMPGGGLSGGGALVLEASTLELRGSIQAKGEGFSAGGSVQILVHDFLGDGLVDVSGGSAGERIGGGGRIAIHAVDRSRFNGALVSGSDIQHQGTVVFADQDPPGASFAGYAPALFDGYMPIPFFAHAAVYVYHVHDQWQDETGAVWNISSPQDLRHLAGVVLVSGEARFEVVEITSLGGNQYILAFRGQPPTPKSRPFVLPIDIQGGR